MRKIKYYILLTIGFTLFSFDTDGQLKDNSYFKAEAHMGFIIPEYKHFNLIVEKPIQSAEISWVKRTTGKTVWEQSYRYPEYGMTFFFTTLGNKEILGEEFALYPFFQTFFVRREKFQFFNQVGLGFGYATRKFDLYDNFENISVGSHVNIHFNFKLGTRFQIAPKLLWSTGLSFAHYSNANMAEPNLGVNLFTAFTGMYLSIGKQDTLRHFDYPNHEKKHEFAFIYAAGGKHTRALQSTIFFTSSISGEYRFHFRRRFRPGIGVDAFYDSATETEMSAPGKDDFNRIDAFRTGIHLSQEFVYDRFSFILQEGIYIGLVNRVDKSLMYNRAMLRWKFNENWMMNISMKSHLHILDYPELGVGYYFTRKL